MATQAANWLGQSLAGRYQITAQLGEGGMATIFKARDTRLGCDVVVKAPHPSVVTDPDFAGRFDREVRSLVQLTHPHVVKVLDVGNHNGLPFAVLQFLPGGNLRQRQARTATSPKRERGFPPRDFRGWLPQVAAALDCIHAQNHVHRDVKPENILFDQAGNAFLGDFGVVKVLNAATERKQPTVVTTSGQVIGTPQYMAPELLAGQPYDGRVDQYALAITVYELLAGRYPFDGPTSAVIFSQQLSEPPPPLTEAVPGLPSGVVAAVERALAKKPEDRFPSCTAFARAFLAGLASGVSDGPGTPSTPGSSLTPLARRTLCPSCGKKLKGLVPGKRFQCPGCRAAFTAAGPALPVLTLPGSPPPPDAADSGAAPVLRNDDFPLEPRRHSLAPWLIGAGTLAVLAVASLVALSMDSSEGTPPPDRERITARGKEKGDREKEKERPDERKPPEQQPPETKPEKKPAEEPQPEKRPPAQPPRQKPPQENPPVRKPPDHPPIKLPAQKPTRPVAPWKDHAEPIWCIACSPNGRFVLTGGGQLALGAGGQSPRDCSLRLWDADSGKLVRRFEEPHARAVLAVAFAPDGRRAASGAADGNVRLWSVAEGKWLLEWSGQGEPIHALAFSPDGKYLVTGSADRSLKIWDVVKERGLRRLIGHSGPVSSVAWSPDGKYVLSGSWDATARLWDVSQAREVRVFEGHGHVVQAVAFSPDGKRVLIAAGLPAKNCQPAEGDADGLHLYDTATGQEVIHVPTSGHAIRSVAFSPDGKRALTAGEDRTVRLWDLVSGKEEARPTSHDDWATAVVFSPDGKRGFSAGRDAIVRPLKLPEPGPLVERPKPITLDLSAEPSRLVHTLRGHTEFIHCVAISPDGKWLVTGGGGKAVDGFLKTGTDFALRVWDFKTGAEVGKLSGHADNVACVAISPDSSRVASGSQDGKIILWDLATRRKEKELAGPREGTSAVAFSPRGSYLASAGMDGVVRVWDVRGTRDSGSGELLRTLRGHTESLLAVLFTPDGKYLLSGGFDKTVRLWDVAAGKEVRVFQGHADPVWALALSPDGKRLLSGSGSDKGPDPGLRLWDLEGKQFAHLPTPGDPVRGLCFCPDGTHAVCSSDEGFFSVWDLEKRKIVRRDEAHQGSATGVTLAPDGRQAVTVSLDRLVKVWRLPEPGPRATRAEAGEVKLTREPMAGKPPEPKPANPKALLRRFAKHGEAVRALAVTHDGRMALSGGGGTFVDGILNKGADHSLLFWEIDTGDVKFRLEGHTSAVTSIALLRDGKSALSADKEGGLLLWNLMTGKQVRKLLYNGPGLLGVVNSVAVSRDGAFALTGGTRLVLWDLKTYRNFKPITGQPAIIQGVALSPDGKFALAGDEFGSVILWSLATFREVRRFKGHSDIVWSVAFSRDGKYVATGAGGRVDAQKNAYVDGEDNTVRVWEAATGRELKVFKSQARDMRSVVFSTNGKRVLSCGRDGAVFLWDVSGVKEPVVFRGHLWFAQQAVFLPGDRRALSASLDKTVCLWDLPE